MSAGTGEDGDGVCVCVMTACSARIRAAPRGTSEKLTRHENADREIVSEAQAGVPDREVVEKVRG